MDPVVKSSQVKPAQQIIDKTVDIFKSSLHLGSSIAQLYRDREAAARKPLLNYYIASDAATVEEVQRFRARVFGEAYQTSFDGGIDHDPYDHYSVHVLVRDDAREHRPIVACTRVVLPEAKQKLGRYYSEHEFELDDYLQGKDQVFEIGRTCVDYAYRGGQALVVMWMGMMPLMLEELGAKCLIGTVSINLSSSLQKRRAAQLFIHDNAVTRPIESRCIYPYDDAFEQASWYVVSMPADELDITRIPYRNRDVPSLVKKYVQMGAVFSREAFWDKDFNSLDYFVGVEINRRLILKFRIFCKLLELRAQSAMAFR